MVAAPSIFMLEFYCSQVLSTSLLGLLLLSSEVTDVSTLPALTAY
jgi:hypothetical protein